MAVGHVVCAWSERLECWGIIGASADEARMSKLAQVLVDVLDATVCVVQSLSMSEADISAAADSLLHPDDLSDAVGDTASPLVDAGGDDGSPVSDDSPFPDDEGPWGSRH